MNLIVAIGDTARRHKAPHAMFLPLKVKCKYLNRKYFGVILMMPRYLKF